MILVVDDDEHRQVQLCEMLDLLEVKYKVIGNASEVPEYVAENEALIHAVLLDILMPDDDLISTLKNHFAFQVDNAAEETGMLLFRFLRKRHRGIPVVVHTVVRQPSIIAFFKQEKIPYLRKPAALTEIIAALEKAAPSDFATGR